MRGVLAALSLAHSNSPLNNATQSADRRTPPTCHGVATRLLPRDAGIPERDGIREAAEEEEGRNGTIEIEQ